MKLLTRKLVQNLLISAMLLMVITGSAAAQGGDFTEPFDDAQMPEWEHSPEAVVKDGVLIIGPGNFAVHIGNYANFNADFKVKYPGQGIIFFQYSMHEGGNYACIFFADRIVFEKVTNGKPVELAAVDWNGFSGDWDAVKIAVNSGRHELTINGEMLLQAQEEDETFNGGALGFLVEGDSAAEFDDLSVAQTMVEGTAAEKTSEPGGELAAAPTEQPAAQTGIEGLLAQLALGQGNPPELATSAVNLLLSVVFAYVLSRVYVHWGTSLSNRRRFAANFILITVTTTFIILIVRSSIALSLGLVGALSIVRFRAAIKEPEELAYLFFAIGIGIGLGDNQRIITLMAVAAVVVVIAVMRLFRGRESDFNLHLTVASSNPNKVSLEAVTSVLKEHTSQLRLMRFDENKNTMEASFLAEFRNGTRFEAAKNALQALSKEIEIVFLDNKGIG